jgi:hypothetical protein
MMPREVVQQRGAVGLGARLKSRAATRRRNRALLVQTKTGDGPPPELRQHHQLADDVTVVDGVEAAVRRVMDQRPIDRYRARGTITDRQWRAADRIAALAFRAGLQPRVTARYDDMPRAPASAETAITSADRARSDYLHAMADLGRGTALAGVVVAVCVMEQTAEEWGRQNGRYNGKTAVVEGMTTLRLALDRLALHWRIT